MFKIYEVADQGTITATGEITIACASEFRDALLHLQDRWSSLIVNLDGLKAIDVAGLQILCSAHRTAIKLNKSILLTGQTNEAVNELAIKAGFVSDKSCLMKEAHECLWAGRKNQ